MRKMWKDRRGATAVEYGLIASIITAALFVPIGKGYSGAQLIGMDLNDKLTYVGNVIFDPANR